jgi:hypothetical protein
MTGWSCSECKPIRARAHYVALSAATPSPVNIQRTAISIGHTIGRITAAVSTCGVLPNALSAWRGKMPPRSKNSEYSPVLPQYPGIESEIGKISRFSHPVVVTPTAKLRIPGRPGILEGGRGLGGWVGALTHACTRRLTCPLLPNANKATQPKVTAEATAGAVGE